MGNEEGWEGSFFGCAINPASSAISNEDIIEAAKSACGASADCAGFNLIVNEEQGGAYAMLFSDAANGGNFNAYGWTAANTVYRKDGPPCAPCQYKD